MHVGENKITHIEENKNPLRFYLLHSILVTKFVAESKRQKEANQATGHQYHSLSFSPQKA